MLGLGGIHKVNLINYGSHEEDELTILIETYIVSLILYFNKTHRTSFGIYQKLLILSHRPYRDI